MRCSSDDPWGFAWNAGQPDSLFCCVVGSTLRLFAEWGALALLDLAALQ